MSRTTRKVGHRDDTGSSVVPYNGLRNPSGRYCYLNCILQPLFMTAGFRDAVKSTAAERPDCIDEELASLFEKLEEDTSSPSEIITKLGLDSVTQQQDAAEYLEKILNLTSPRASQIFRGELSRTIKCSRCSTETGNDGPFWLLHIEMGKSRKLIATYVPADEPCIHHGVNGALCLCKAASKCLHDKHVLLSGLVGDTEGFDRLFSRLKLKKENQVYCQKCGVKRDATIQSHVLVRPDVLMLLLKRFQTDTQVKAPLKLDRMGHHYELYAFVQHFRYQAGGHYTATIKANDGWYTFSDEAVHRDMPDCKNSNVKLPNAYLLFYQKTKQTKKLKTTGRVQEDRREPSRSPMNVKTLQPQVPKGTKKSENSKNQPEDGGCRATKRIH